MSDGQHDEIAPVTPGEIHKQEFLAGFGLSQAVLARALERSPNGIAEIVHNRRITAATALRLGLFFRTAPEFWQNLQAHYDLKMARRALPSEVSERITAQRVAQQGVSTRDTRPYGPTRMAGAPSPRSGGRPV